MSNCNLYTLVDNEDYIKFNNVKWRFDKRYVVRVNINGRLKHIGSFSSIHKAKLEHDKACLKYHGDFAFIES